jgi:hypothetical protein
MENQGFSIQLLEGKGSLTTMPPPRNVQPKASPLSAKAKGLAGPSPNNPRHPTQTSHIVDDHNQSPPAGDRCGADKVIGMRDLPSPRQPTRVASILRGTGHRWKPHLVPAPGKKRRQRRCTSTPTKHLEKPRASPHKPLSSASLHPLVVAAHAWPVTTASVDEDFSKPKDINPLQITTGGSTPLH